MRDCDIDKTTLVCVNCGWAAPFFGIKRNCQKYYPATRIDDNAMLVESNMTCGPGCHLSKQLARLGFKKIHGCKCSDHAKRMDAWGCDECESRIDEICDWLKEEARKRGIPYLSVVSRMLVRRAISNARREAERAKADT